MAQIELTNASGQVVGVAIVDDEDRHKFSGRWHVHVNGCRGFAGRPYAVRKRRGIKSFLHREVLGLGPVRDDERRVDHINRDTLDNRKANLRVATPAENQQNKGIYKNCKSGFRGVSWDRKTDKWRARVQLLGKNAFCGYYGSLDEAANAVKAARSVLMPFSEEAAT